MLQMYVGSVGDIKYHMWVAAHVGCLGNFTMLYEYCNWIFLFEDLKHIHPTSTKALGIHYESAVMLIQKVV